MIAVRRVEPGKVSVEEVPEPEPGPDDVVVDIAYAAVNPFDMQVLRGQIGADPTRRLTLGTEATGYLAGRPVLVSGGGLGVSRDGTFAPRVVVSRDAMRALPEDVDLRSVTGVGVAGRTAWRVVHQLAAVTSDDLVLVLGATGGVGQFAVQLAARTGATVLAHTGSSAKATALEALGVEGVVADAPGALAEALDGREPSVVLDPLGGDYVSTLFAHVTTSARIVTYGVLAGATTTFDLARLYGRGIKVQGTSGGTTSPADNAEALAGVLDAVVGGDVLVASEVLPLAEGPTAFDRLAARTVIGKLLLAP